MKFSNLVLLFLVVLPHDISCIYGMYYAKYSWKGSYCEFKGYVPGGNRVIVQKIKPPVAQMEKGLFKGLAGNLGKASSAAQHSVMLTKGFGKLANLAPKLGPALGLFGVAFSVLKGFTDPTPDEILDAANKAIEKLTDEVNNRLDEMKGYVTQKTIELEKDITGRQYKSLFLLWTNCIKETTKAKVDECQRDAANQIMSSRPIFAIKSSNVHGNIALSTDDTKRLEANLLTFRNYVVLCLASLRALTATLKDQPTNKADYDRYAKDLNSEIEWSVKYVENAVSMIKQMHTGGDNCKDTFKCGKFEEIREGFWLTKVHTANQITCTCVHDRADVSTRTCGIHVITRHDGKRGLQYYKYYRTGQSSEERGAKWIAQDLLHDFKHEPFIKKLEESINNYWDGEVLDLVDSWKSLLTAVENDDQLESDQEREQRLSIRSDDYMRRVKQVEDQMEMELDAKYADEGYYRNQRMSYEDGRWNDENDRAPIGW